MLRATAATTRVVSALAAGPGGWRYGYELLDETGLKSGSLYPILMRLADRGMLDAAWEADPPPGRPRRHHYRLTPAGRAWLRELENANNARKGFALGVAG
jgi:DNA-binding PadR family transcriptional regulator